MITLNSPSQPNIQTSIQRQLSIPIANRSSRLRGVLNSTTADLLPPRKRHRPRPRRAHCRAVQEVQGKIASSRCTVRLRHSVRPVPRRGGGRFCFCK
ncbi:hypothetical protein FF1_041550 [Malus domestica]